MSVFKKLWGNSDKVSSKQKEAQVDEIKEHQPLNPFTECLFLEQHADIVRLLINIDCRRCVSAGDDNLAVVWDVQFGYKIAILSGHSRPVTAMIPVQCPGMSEPRLITGSSDKQIRVWDIETGDCLMVLTEHNSSVKCLVQFGTDGLFCSGGGNLCLWSASGALLHTCTPNREESDIGHMITLRNDRVVTASGEHLAVYVVSEGKELSLVKYLQPAREMTEPIMCVVSIRDDLFASGSLDGSINIWRTDTLSLHQSLNTVANPEGPDKTFPHSVSVILPLSEHYMCAAVGSGFAVYDVDNGDTILHKHHAHFSKINQMTFTCDGLYLATCAVDGSIRLWSYPDVIEDSILGEHPDSLKHIKTEHSYLGVWYILDESRLALVGECLAHDGPVQCVLDSDGETLVSCGVDGLVCVWKNGNIQMLKRSHVLQTRRLCGGIV